MKPAISTITGVLIAFTVSVPAGAQGIWTTTLPMRPQTQQHLDLFRDGTAYAYSAQDNIVYASTDYGLTWTPRPSAPGPYAAVAFGTPELGYAAIFGGDFLVTRDGASTWKRAPGPLPASEGLYHALDVADRGKVVVVGGQHEGNGCRRDDEGTVSIWYGRNGGKKWREKKLPFFGTVRSVDMLNARTGVAIIYDRFVAQDESTCFSSSNSVWLTRDGFKTMRKIYDCSDGEICTAVTMASRSRIFVGTNNADLYISIDGGARFKRVGRFSGPYESVGEPFFWIGGLGFATPKIGYMSTKGGGTWRTRNGGLTWTEEHSTERVWGAGIGDLAVADPEHAIAGGPNFVIARTSDGP
ncbi:MAG: hypothetical protein M3280_05420 [Actinomycetota bacterium]|nr:hypothetical protein [Actinomycetota bacterium]